MKLRNQGLLVLVCCLGFFLNTAVAMLRTPIDCSVEDFHSFRKTLFQDHIKETSVGISTFKVRTSYGCINVEEPVLRELFCCQALLRTQDIHQYGFVRYLHPWVEQYSRYAHSINVWALLRLFGASIDEQIAGLLHDVSHTVFSHVGDYVYAGRAENGCAYQDVILKDFLREMGVGDILQRHGYSLDLFDKPLVMLEQKSPNLCADRLEYTIYAGRLNKDKKSGRLLLDDNDVLSLLRSLRFDVDTQAWFFDDVYQAYKFAYVSLYTTEYVVGAAWNHLVYNWMADAVVEAMDKKIITEHDFRYSSDSYVWQILMSSKNAVIKKAMEKVCGYKDCFALCTDSEPCDCVVYTKFRGIDPLVRIDAEEKGYILSSLSSLYKLYPQYLDASEYCVSQAFADEYARVKSVIARGWRVKFIGECAKEKQVIRDVIS